MLRATKLKDFYQKASGQERLLRNILIFLLAMAIFLIGTQTHIVFFDKVLKWNATYIFITYAVLLCIACAAQIVYLRIWKNKDGIYTYCPECRRFFKNAKEIKELIVTCKCNKCFNVIVEDDINIPPTESA